MEAFLGNSTEKKDYLDYLNYSVLEMVRQNWHPFDAQYVIYRKEMEAIKSARISQNPRWKKGYAPTRHQFLKEFT